MIGIDISDRSIKIVQFSGGNQPELLGYAGITMPEGLVKNGVVKREKEVLEHLHQTLKAAGVSKKSDDVVVASIPETQSFLRVIEIPKMQEDEIAEAIRWEVAQHIPFGIENVYIDWQSMSGSGHKTAEGRREVQVGAAQREVVDMLHKTLSSFNFDVAAFELEGQAIVRALISPDLKRKQGLLIIDLGGSATNVIIYDHGAIRFTATLQRGVETFFDQLGGTVQKPTYQRGDLDQEAESALAERLTPSLEELAIEVRGVVEFYNSIDAQHEVKEVILTGGGANIPGLDKVFIRHFDTVQVQRGNPWATMRPNRSTIKPPMDVRESVRYTTALGLAMRKVLI